VTGCANRSPTAADAIEDKVQEALAICGGSAIAALRITLIANAFLEAEIDRLSAAVSSGFARGKVRKPARPNEAKEKIQHCKYNRNFHSKSPNRFPRQRATHQSVSAGGSLFFQLLRPCDNNDGVRADAIDTPVTSAVPLVSAVLISVSCKVVA
jgi:hypothetical protein